MPRGGRAGGGGRGSTGPSTPRPAPRGAAPLTPEAQLLPLQGTQPTPPWPADPCLPPPSCAGPCVTLFPSRPPRHSFTPTTPSDGSSSRQPSWVPLLSPGPCTPLGCWGGGRRTPSGPHGCSQQAWGGQTRWLREPPCRGVGGRGLTCELGPQSRGRLERLGLCDGGRLVLQLAVVDPVALQEAVQALVPWGLQRHHGQGPGCMLASRVGRRGVAGSRQSEGPGLMARGQAGVPLMMRNEGIRGQNPVLLVLRVWTRACLPVQPGHPSPRAEAGDCGPGHRRRGSCPFPADPEPKGAADAAWPCVVHHWPHPIPSVPDPPVHPGLWPSHWDPH